MGSLWLPQLSALVSRFKRFVARLKHGMRTRCEQSSVARRELGDSVLRPALSTWSKSYTKTHAVSSPFREYLGQLESANILFKRFPATANDSGSKYTTLRGLRNTHVFLLTRDGKTSFHISNFTKSENLIRSTIKLSQYCILTSHTNDF